MKPNIFAEAEAQWPEDEAYHTYRTFSERMADARDADDREWSISCLQNDIAHMHRCFARHSDGDELIARYDVALRKHRGITAAGDQIEIPAIMSAINTQ